MKPLNGDKQLGLVSPLKCAAGQSNQITNLSKKRDGAGRRRQLQRLPSVCFGTGREHKLNLLCGLFGVSDSKWMSGSAESRNQKPRGNVAQQQILIKPIARSPKRAQKILCFSVDNDLHGWKPVILEQSA